MKFRKFATLILMIVMFVSCRQAYAIETTPFFQIAEDYAINIINARKLWLGREICIEGIVTAILATKLGDEASEGDAIVWLSERSENNFRRGDVKYYFYFDGIPDEIMELQEGQRVRLSGIVSSIEPSRIVLRVTVNEAKLEEDY